jgi:hypothetical protein
LVSLKKKKYNNNLQIGWIFCRFQSPVPVSSWISALNSVSGRTLDIAKDLIIWRDIGIRSILIGTGI